LYDYLFVIIIHVFMTTDRFPQVIEQLQDIVNQKLQRWMKTAFQSVWDEKVKHDIDMRTAAYIITVTRLVNGYKVRGIWP
jgi:glutamate dehydrogenase/leucine dehydrogenase